MIGSTGRVVDRRRSVSARPPINKHYKHFSLKYLHCTVIMTRQRNSSYSSSTLSSTSSTSSSATYASISDSISSYASRLSLSLQSKSTDFWNQFERGSRKRGSVSSVFKKMFTKRARGEPEKTSSSSYLAPPAQPVKETSFIEHQPRVVIPARNSVIIPSHHQLPAGLYCVIEDFLTEYDLRLLEEEERAEMLARHRGKSTEL